MVPSPTDLCYFIEIATSLNITRASERLGVSQPSLTLAMQRLEYSVGTTLLLRSKKGVMLTQAGKQLQAHAKMLLQSWDVVKNRAQASMNAAEGSYVLGCHQSVALYSLPLFLPDLLRNYPGIELRLMHHLSRKIAESVVRMEADIGIVVNPVRHADLIIKKLCNDEVGFWSNPNATINNTVLICDPDLLQSRDLLNQLKKNNITFERMIESSSLEVIATLTACGAGIGILPGRVARATSNALTLLTNMPTYHDEICLVYRVENKQVRAIQILAQAITNAFKIPAPSTILHREFEQTPLSHPQHVPHVFHPGFVAETRKQDADQN